ncbi:MAG: CBM96 family carbohydrate-binding protein [Promethearchaeota archaeon]
MKFYSKKTIFFFLGLILILGIIFILPKGWSITREKSISSIADKDTYVDTANAMSNYGGVNNLMTGFSMFGDIRESYFYFNFDDKPDDYLRAEISLEFWGVYQTMNFTVCLIEESWDEFSMTWLNKPSKGDIIGNILVTSSGIYIMDVTSVISGKSDFSICVYVEFDNFIEDYVYITSREGYYSVEDAPQLLWIYTETAEITITNPMASINWQEFNTYNITWSSVGVINTVKIELFKASSLIEELTFINTANDGNFEFYVSSLENYQAGSDYRIKISDYDDSNVYDFSDSFSINTGTTTNGPDLPFSIPNYNIFLIIGISSLIALTLIKKITKKTKHIH